MRSRRIEHVNPALTLQIKRRYFLDRMSSRQDPLEVCSHDENLQLS